MKLSEYRRGGHIRLGRFWLRRARRLLPAVGVMIAVTMIVAAIVEPERTTALRGDAISSLAYVANWHFALGHQSYFDQFQRPSSSSSAGAGSSRAAATSNQVSRLPQPPNSPR